MHPTRIFKSAEDLKQAWEEYKEWIDSQAQKWVKIQYVGKDGMRVEDKPPMPYDLDGFCCWYTAHKAKGIPTTAWIPL